MSQSGDDRAAILARRARFVAMALLGSSTVSATACTCLSVGVDANPRGDGGVDAREVDANPGDAPEVADGAGAGDASDAETP